MLLMEDNRIIIKWALLHALAINTCKILLLVYENSNKYKWEMKEERHVSLIEPLD